MNSPWRIELFGGFSLSGENEVITRFQTRKTAALLAYLACHRDRVGSREVLAELLWPNTTPEAARNSLRVALNSLRRQLEPPGVPVGGVLVTDRTSVHLNPDAFVTDVQEFETFLRREKSAAGREVRIAALRSAVPLYRGPLLSGWYEEWIDLERTRWAEVYGDTLRRLTALLIEAGQLPTALEYARRAVHADPLREDAHQLLLRLYGAMNRPTAAREQFQQLTEILRDQMNTVPSLTTRNLLQKIESGDGEILGQELFVAEEEEPEPVDDSPIPLPEEPDEISSPIGSIPPRLTRFWGRRDELARLQSLLSAPPADKALLVTITGPGGTGKSRLAIEAAARFLHEIGERQAEAGCWVVTLDETATQKQIESLFLKALHLSARYDSPPLEQIVQTLSNRTAALLVLDDVAAPLGETEKSYLRELKDRLPHLRLLVTSRQRLGIRDEREMILSPLPVPVAAAEERDTLPTASELEEWAACPSVALFLDRARAVRPDFQITLRNAEAIGALCRRLDGLPLAIELTAAWIRLLSPAQMLSRLEDRFDLLTSDRRRERRGIASRPRSLRAVMEESFRLLSEPLRLFLARLCVFRNGWFLEAAQTVAIDAFPNDGTAYADALEFLDALRQRSLVVTASEIKGSDDGAIRFRLLETVRYYAEQTLSADQQAAAQEAHRSYFLSQAKNAFVFLAGEDADEWLARLEMEGDNLRAAFAHSLTVQPEDAVRLTAYLWRFWYGCGHQEEGFRLAESALSRWEEAEPSTVVGETSEALRGAGRLALNLGNVGRAYNYLEKSAHLLDSSNSSPATQAMMQTEIVLAARAGGDRTGERNALQKLLLLNRELKDHWAEARTLAALAENASAEGDREQQECWGVEARRIEPLFLTELGESAPSLARALLDLGEMAVSQGDYGAGLPTLREAFAAYQRAGNEEGAALARERMARAYWRQGEDDKMRRAAEEALLLRGNDARPANDFLHSLLAGISPA